MSGSFTCFTSSTIADAALRLLLTSTGRLRAKDGDAVVRQAMIQRLRYASGSKEGCAIYHPLFCSLSPSPMLMQLMPTIASPSPMDTSASTFGSL